MNLFVSHWRISFDQMVSEHSKILPSKIDIQGMFQLIILIPLFLYMQIGKWSLEVVLEKTKSENTLLADWIIKNLRGVQTLES